MKGMVFLDFDDVLCLSGSGARGPAEAVFHLPAVDAMQRVVNEFQPDFVVTSSWQLRVDRQEIEQVLSANRLHSVAIRLHGAWCAPTPVGGTRHDAVVGWLTEHRQGQPFVVIDDTRSSSSFKSSPMQREGRVVLRVELCDAAVGLHAGHLATVRKGLESRI